MIRRHRGGRQRLPCFGKLSYPPQNSSLALIIVLQLALLPAFLASDESKLVLFILVCAVLLFGSRLFSRRHQSDGTMSATDFTQTPYRIPEQLDDSLERMELHPEMQFDKLKLRKFYFAKLDAMTGPPDPFEFADELTVEVEHADSGNRSTWQFTVGTPAGFARLLEHKEWESFYSPETFVIRKYELEMVREMVMEHIESLVNGDAGKTRTPEPPPVA